MFFCIEQSIGQQTNTQYCMFVTQSGIMPSVAMLSVIEMYIDEMTHLYNFTISLVKSKKKMNCLLFLLRPSFIKVHLY
jgi:hypothetical protein